VWPDENPPYRPTQREMAGRMDIESTSLRRFKCLVDVDPGENKMFTRSLLKCLVDVLLEL
jgi:hypothetical protein